MVSNYTPSKSPSPMPTNPSWTNEKSRYETDEGFARRIERRAILAKAREEAEIVVRDGREFRLIKLPERFGAK